MKQLVLDARSGELAVAEVPPPALRPGRLLVRTRASLVSAGTERLAVGFARQNLLAKARARPDLLRQTLAKVKRDGLAAAARTARARLDQPLALGYSAAGVVAGVGAGLEGRYSAGQRVAVAGAGVANHAELNLVPANLAAAVPTDVADEEACYATVCAVALHAVRQSRPALGAWCAVVGVGLVGQLAAQLLALSGVRVLALDFDAERLALATRLGANAACKLDEQDAGAVAAEATGGIGCDAVVIAAATTSSLPFETAAEVARDRAVVAVVGNTGTSFPYREYMNKELTVVVCRSYGPGRYDEDYESHGFRYPPGYVRWTETANLAAALAAMRPGSARRLDPAALTTHRFGFEDALAAYATIAGQEPHLGVLLKYADTPAPGDSPPARGAPSRTARWGAPSRSPAEGCLPARGAPSRSPAEGSCKPHPEAAKPSLPRRPAARCRLGVIGAGDHARSVLLPILAKLPACELHTVATARGLSAAHTQRRLGFRRATADADEIFEDEDIDAVVVAAPHSLHASQTTRALAAGKPVFVEKPLALNWQELRDVAAAAEASAAFLLVGFNRRFAPLALAAKAHLTASPGPRHVLMRVNAGPLPAGSWQGRTDEGGGRLLGEACHFIDLGAFLGGARVASVQAQAVPAAANGLCEDATIVLRLNNDSLATVFYTASGSPASGKELIEAYAGGDLARIEDFRRLSLWRKGRRQRRRQRQDKGHRTELAAFVAAVAAGGPPPVPLAEQLNASAATLAALDSVAAEEQVAVHAP